MSRYDVIIVGAGVSGAATAALLACTHLRILLVDRAFFPRDKVCGEGIMPAGVAILDQLRLLDELAAAGAEPFRGLNLSLNSGLTLNLDFSELDPPGRGLACSRLHLDHLLVQKARKLGATVKEGCSVTSIETTGSGFRVVAAQQGQELGFESTFLIGADGIRSRFHREFGFKRVASDSQRFALRTLYHNVSGLEERVEVHCSPKGEAYLAPMGGSAARITLLLSSPGQTEQMNLQERYYSALQSFPALLERLPDPFPGRDVEASAPLGLRVSPPEVPGFFLIGDAAGAVDPITGQGISIGLKDGMLVSDILQNHLQSPTSLARPDREYWKQREIYFRPAHELARQLLFFLRWSWLSHRACRTLEKKASLRQRLLRQLTTFSAGERFNWQDHARLVCGL